MLQLIYMSTASDRLTDLDEALEQLCKEAARNNAHDEITGVLMGEGRQFLQVLEGPKEVVENTFLRIVVDDRHHGLLLLSRRMRTVREFGEWSMALCDGPIDRDEMVERVRLLLKDVSLNLRQAFDAAFPPRACRTAAAAVALSGAAPPS